MKNSGTVVYLETNINILKRRMNLSERLRRPLLKEFSLDEIYEFRKVLMKEQVILLLIVMI